MRNYAMKKHLSKSRTNLLPVQKPKNAGVSIDVGVNKDYVHVCMWLSSKTKRVAKNAACVLLISHQDYFCWYYTSRKYKNTSMHLVLNSGQVLTSKQSLPFSNCDTLFLSSISVSEELNVLVTLSYYIDFFHPKGRSYS